MYICKTRLKISLLGKDRILSLVDRILSYGQSEVSMYNRSSKKSRRSMFFEVVWREGVEREGVRERAGLGLLGFLTRIKI